jgi:hypothetical protein
MPRVAKIPEERTKPYTVFGDEACITDRWMVIGSTTMADTDVEPVSRLFAGMKSDLGLRDEIKWGHTQDGTVDRYAQIVSRYFLLLHNKILQFHSVTVDRWFANYKKYAHGSPQVGYNLFICQLLLKHFRIYPAEAKYHAVLDRRTSKLPLEPFKVYLNVRGRDEYGLDHWPYRIMEFEDSKKSIILQVNDLVLGAVGFAANHKDRRPEHADSPKARLFRHVLKESGLLSIRRDTVRGQNDFTIWNIEFNGMPPKGARKQGKRRKRRPGCQRGASAHAKAGEQRAAVLSAARPTCK